MRSIIFTLFCLSCFAFTRAQEVAEDTVALPEVVINAFNNNLKMKDVGAPVSLLSNKQLTRNQESTILPALNTVPGVRMEERSPGSYRLSIRGSSLRSPFGVRNVKVYFDGIPYTDPGGNSYLNQLGFYNVRDVEVIRGPGSSLYGAGTGGVLLLSSVPSHFRQGLELNYSFGSFNMHNIAAAATFGKEAQNTRIGYQHIESDGFRDHTNMRRDVMTIDNMLSVGENGRLQSHFLYADLYYQTPGGLTEKEFALNPKAARPAAGIFPSSETARAAIYQKTFLAGISATNRIADGLENMTAIYGAYTQLRNPAVRNYGRTSEPHFGGRTVFTYHLPGQPWLTLNAGAEYQQSFNTQRVYDNKNGEPDSLQSDDEIYNSQGFVFLQGTASLDKWIITGGVSINRLTLDFRRLSTIPSQEFRRSYKDEWMPRISLLRRLTPNLSVYGTVSRGFSAPTTGEVLPSANILNTTLQAENGWNYEAGVKANVLDNRLLFNLNAFYFALQNAIVQRRDASGADYFENGGSAKEQGFEAAAEYEFIQHPGTIVRSFKTTLSATLNDFHYKTFKQVNDDYSGNFIPGVAQNSVAFNADLVTVPGFYVNASLFHSGKIWLNDGNAASSAPYDLLGCRIGYRILPVDKAGVEIFIGGDNLLDERYSLGNDINAAAGRYYNLAPGMNFYAGGKLRLPW